MAIHGSDTFDQYFDPDGKTLAANMRRNNAKAWQVIVSDLPDSLFYYLLLQKHPLKVHPFHKQIIQVQ